MDIPLTQGKVAHIDPEDWERLWDHTWYAAESQGIWYACAAPLGGGRNKARIKMHNLVMGRKWIDHKDGNGLNNRKANLRPCDNAQNQQNTQSRKGSSRFKGVSWVKRRQRWLVAFRCHGEHHFVGYFRDETEAASAYNEAVLPLAGEFAILNPV